MLGNKYRMQSCSYCKYELASLLLQMASTE